MKLLRVFMGILPAALVLLCGDCVHRAGQQAPVRQAKSAQQVDVERGIVIYGLFWQLDFALARQEGRERVVEIMRELQMQWRRLPRMNESELEDYLRYVDVLMWEQKEMASAQNRRYGAAVEPPGLSGLSVASSAAGRLWRMCRGAEGPYTEAARELVATMGGEEVLGVLLRLHADAADVDRPQWEERWAEVSLALDLFVNYAASAAESDDDVAMPMLRAVLDELDARLRKDSRERTRLTCLLQTFIRGQERASVHAECQSFRTERGWRCSAERAALYEEFFRRLPALRELRYYVVVETEEVDVGSY